MMRKNKKRKKTPKYIKAQLWSTLMVVDDEPIDRMNIWEFYYFAASTIVPLLEDFLEVAEFKVQKSELLYNNRPPEECVSVADFRNMISAINLLVRYNNEGGLKYKGKEINFEGGDTIVDLLDALHLFVNVLPYLNDRHFTMLQERYMDAPNGRHCDFDELCNLDKTIAKRIFPTFHVFAKFSIFPPRYFKRMYYSYPLPDSARSKEQSMCNEWDVALAMMVRSWEWMLEREPSVNSEGWEEVPEKIYLGLHLFAEYLPEMQND